MTAFVVMVKVVTVVVVTVTVVVKALLWDGEVIKMSVEVLVIDVWSDVVVGTWAGVVVINAVNEGAIA